MRKRKTKKLSFRRKAEKQMNKPVNKYRSSVGFRNRHVTRQISVLVTAPLNAGKSTLINAIAGAPVVPTSNLPSEAVVHIVRSVSGQDWESIPQRSSSSGTTELIQIQVRFPGCFSGQPLCFYDLPASNTETTRTFVEKQLKRRRYDAALYLLNAEQLQTQDDKQQLLALQAVLNSSRVLFVLNKADRLDGTEDGPLPEVVERAARYLRELGFQEPLICPLSAKAAFLANKQSPLTMNEQRRFTSLYEQMESGNIARWYDRFFPGLRFVEKLTLRIPGDMGTVPGLRFAVPPGKTGELLQNCGFSGFAAVFLSFLQHCMT